MNENYEFFYGGIYSQWYKRPFIDEFGTEFNCCEQFMMFHKAMLFNNYDIAMKVMNSNSPKEQKELGRKVKNFDIVKWEKFNFRIVYKGNYYKFSQNDDLMTEMLSTRNKHFVEASPYDEYWGIGLSIDEAKNTLPKYWKGKNMLGEVLTVVKQNIQKIYTYNGSVK